MSEVRRRPMDDAVVVITGANNPNGIGAAVARRFVQLGAKVMITYLRLDPARWEVTEAELRAAEDPGDALYQRFRSQGPTAALDFIGGAMGSVATFEVDLRDGLGAARQIFDRTEDLLGVCDVLVNCASHYPLVDGTMTVSENDFAETYAVNATATMLTTQEFARRFQASGRRSGRVINFSTDAAGAFPGQVAYGSSKAAIEAITRATAIELGPFNITVNAIAPGPIQTGYISPDAEERVAVRIPVARVGTPEDIAHAAVFLAARESSFITGQILKVDGGHTL